MLFPNVCEFCGRNESGPEEAHICGECRNSPNAIKALERPFCELCGWPYEGAITTAFRCGNCADLKLEFKSARAAAHYGGLVKEVIHRFKYDRKEWFEPFLANILINAALPALRDPGERPDIVAPIPLHPRKMRVRGFNQAERLASRVAAALGVPHAPRLLRRIKETESQARLDRDDREANVRGAFAYAGEARLNGGRALLIDDVLTTGLTASECAKVLLKNGAAEVIVWTVARGGFA